MSDARRNGPIAWMAEHRIAANLLVILLIGGGVWTAIHVQKEVFPQFQLDAVQVSVGYPGAAPEEVEKGILLPIEEAVRGLQGIEEITSTAREGRGSLTIELVAGTDRMQAFQEIDQAINRIRTFPDDIDQPDVQLVSEQRGVMSIGLYGEVDVWSLRVLAEQLRDQLLADPNITQVELPRVAGYVTHVEIPLATLRRHKLTLGEVAELIEQSSRDVPAGVIETHSGEIRLRMNERKQWGDEFASIPIVASSDGSTVTLGDIATITDGFEEASFHSLFNQQPTVGIRVFRIGDQSPLVIAAAVERVLDDFRATAPPGVKVRIDRSSARDYEDRLALLVENGILAVAIVIVILALFLELRLAFWVMMGMVVSFLGGIIFMPVLGVSVNMISMFGFLVVLGIVVDDAIVVGENVYEHRRRGKSYLAAAIAGTREVATPVVFSILTTIVAFVPLLFIPGETGLFWWPLPIVVIAVLSLSLFEALFILPAHVGHEARHVSSVERWINARQQTIADAISRGIDRFYSPLLGASLRYRYVTVAVALALLLMVGGYGYSGHMGMVMMPEVAADEIEAGVRLPVGVTPEQAAAVALEVTEATQRMFDEYDLHDVAYGIKTNVRGGSFVDVEIVMKPPDQRDMTAREVIALWRDRIGDIQGVDQITFEAERGPGGYRQDIEVDLSHSDIAVLEKASRAFFERVERYTETKDVSDNYDKGKSQLDIELLPEGLSLGLTSTAVGRQVRDAFFGALALRQLRGTNEIEVRVKLPESEREDIHVFDDFIVRAPDGTEVPLRDIARVERSESFNSITHRDGRRVVSVSMDVEPASATTRVLEALENEELPRLRADFPGLTWTFQGAQAEMHESTQALWGGFAIAMAVVYSLLAVAFRSYVQPLIVLSAVPFGIVGAVIGHILLGYDLSLVSLMGVVALAGVVVNDSLIMIDFANRNRADAPAFDAIHRAGMRRFRPILLTTLTTAGGLMPIILETSGQARHLIPMAISLGFGIVFATAIVLLLVPSLYLIVDDLSYRTHGMKSSELTAA